MNGMERIPVPQSRADLAINAIRTAILSGVLNPGQQLVERTLAAQLGVSKTPIREAIRFLQNTGLVESHPTRGVIVRRVDARLVENLYEFRLLVEPTAVRLSVPHHTKDSLRRIRETLESAHELGDQHDLPELTKRNRTFHELLYEPCPNDLLRVRLSGMRDELALVASSGWRAKPSWDLEAQEHLAILEAIEDGKEILAGELTHNHIESAWSRLLTTIEAPSGTEPSPSAN